MPFNYEMSDRNLHIQVINKVITFYFKDADIWDADNKREIFKSHIAHIKQKESGFPPGERLSRGVLHSKIKHSKKEEEHTVHEHINYLLEVTPHIFRSFLTQFFDQDLKNPNPSNRFFADENEVFCIIGKFDKYYQSYKGSLEEAEFLKRGELSPEEQRQHAKELRETQIEDEIATCNAQRLVSHIRMGIISNGWTPEQTQQEIEVFKKVNLLPPAISFFVPNLNHDPRFPLEGLSLQILNPALVKIPDNLITEASPRVSSSTQMDSMQDAEHKAETENLAPIPMPVSVAEVLEPQVALAVSAALVGPQTEPGPQPKSKPEPQAELKPEPQLQAKAQLQTLPPSQVSPVSFFAAPPKEGRNTATETTCNQRGPVSPPSASARPKDFSSSLCRLL